MATKETIQNLNTRTNRVLQGVCSGITFLFILLSLTTSSNAQNNQISVNLGGLTDHLFVFTDGSKEAKWQTSKFGYVGNVAVNGLKASEGGSIREKIPYAGIVSTNATTLDKWQSLINYNPTQATSSFNQTSKISALTNDLNNAFAQINALQPSAGYTSVNAMSLNGMNTMNGRSETFVINITSGLKVTARIYITGDADDTYILRWDEDGNPNNGYKGKVEFQRGAAIIPMGNLKPTNFIHVAGEISGGGGGSTPPAPYPQGPRLNFGKGALIANGADFDGGGFFTGYWLTTGNPRNRETGSLSYVTFVGGWYTSAVKFQLTRNSGGVYVGSQCRNLEEITGDNTVTAGSTINLVNQSAGGTWSSSNTSIATVNMNTGLVQGMSPGSATIYYNVPNSCSSAIKNITVTNNRVLRLGNMVWYDQNRNGKQDANEMGVNGVKLNIYKDDNSDNIPDGAAFASTYSNINGNYSFNNLLPGNYIVGMEMPSGYLPSMTSSTSNTPDNDNNTDNNGITFTSGELRSASISLVIGMEPTNDGDDSNGNMTLDFGLTGTGSIGNFVWSDTNGNGIQDADIEVTESGLADVLVTLTYPNGATETRTTGSTGMYTFSYLAPGTYSVSFAKPEGYNSSPALQGSNTNTDSDPVNGVVSNVVLNPGENNYSIDAGFQGICLSLMANAISQPITQTNGTATILVNATGGLPPYNGTGAFTVPEGEFWFIVTDSYGCSSTVFVRNTSSSTMNRYNPSVVNKTENSSSSITLAPEEEEQSTSSMLEKVGAPGISLVKNPANPNDNGSISLKSNIVASVFPNPCISTGNINFSYMKAHTHATVEVFSMTGMKIATVFNDYIKQNETYTARFDAGSIPSGTYLYKITCGNEAKTGRIIIQ